MLSGNDLQHKQQFMSIFASNPDLKKPSLDMFAKSCIQSSLCVGFRSVVKTIWRTRVLRYFYAQVKDFSEGARIGLDWQ